jgi:hypothetical protein
MKKILILLLLSICFPQKYGGLGLGYSSQGVSFNMMYSQYKKSVGHFTESYSPRYSFFVVLGATANNPSEDMTYDFSPTLFDDEDRGTHTHYMWLVGGIPIKIGENTHINLGGGLSMSSEYYKRYDSYQILGEDGKYYIENDDGGGVLPTFYVSTFIPMKRGFWGMTHLGLSFNLNPIDIGISFVRDI